MVVVGGKENNAKKKTLEFDVSPSTGTEPSLNPEQPGGMEKKEGVAT